jgi:hypothetical protein
MDAPKHGPGRPRKYGRPSRAVTVTLPEDSLARLAAIDADVGRAIVSLVDSARDGRAQPPAPAELAAHGRHAVILVVPAHALKKLTGVRLVPIGNGRALISLDRATSIPQFELSVRDAIDQNGLRGIDRAVLQGIAEILRRARQSHAVSLAERSIIVLESNQPRPRR